jgi:hypothetical protein
MATVMDGILHECLYWLDAESSNGCTILLNIAIMCIQIVEQQIDIFNAPSSAVLIFVNRSPGLHNDEIEILSGGSHDFIFLPLYTENTLSIFANQKLINTITTGLQNIILSPKISQRELWLSTNAFSKYNISWQTIKESIENVDVGNNTTNIINVAKE